MRTLKVSWKQVAIIVWRHYGLANRATSLTVLLLLGIGWCVNRILGNSTADFVAWLVAYKWPWIIGLLLYHFVIVGPWATKRLFGLSFPGFKLAIIDTAQDDEGGANREPFQGAGPPCSSESIRMNG